MIIKGVREEKSKAGDDMVVVAFDFAKNDKQPGYFTESFEKDIRPDKKWPSNGTSWILTMDSQDKTKVSKSFKSFVTAFERSNGVECEWGNKFCDQFKGKKIGGVFGLVEEEYNGKVSKKHKLRWFCEDAKADTQNIPREKLLPGHSASTDSIANNIPANATDEEIPF